MLETAYSEYMKISRQCFGILYRKFYGHSNTSKLNNFICLVSVHYLHEYAVLVWDPHQEGLIDSLEKVKKFALKLYVC